MSAGDFNDRFAQKVKTERKIINEILQDILFAEDHRYHLELGFSSLFDWLTVGHGYSEGSAQRRIQSARLMRQIPELAQKLAEGSVNLSTAAKAQSAFKIQEKSGPKLSPAKKLEIIEQLENKTSMETDKILHRIFPELNLPSSSTVLDEEALNLLKRVRELLAHAQPEASPCDLIKHLANDFLDRKDPLRKPTAVTAKQRVNGTGEARVRRLTFQKSKMRCEYQDPESGRVCGSTYRLEIDHIRPKSLGGTDDPSNLRCLCRAHNQFMSEKWLGRRKANQWRQSGVSVSADSVHRAAEEIIKKSRF